MHSQAVDSFFVHLDRFPSSCHNAYKYPKFAYMYPEFLLTNRFKFRRPAKLAVVMVVYSKCLGMTLIYRYMLLSNHGNHFHGIKL